MENGGHDVVMAPPPQSVMPSEAGAIGMSVYEISPRAAVLQAQSDYDPYSRNLMGAPATPPPPMPVNISAPVAVKCPPPIPKSVPSQRSAAPPVPAPPMFGPSVSAPPVSAPPMFAPPVPAPPVSAPPMFAPPVPAPPVSAPPVPAPPVPTPPMSAPPVPAPPVPAPPVPTPPMSAPPVPAKPNSYSVGSSVSQPSIEQTSPEKDVYHNPVYYSTSGAPNLSTSSSKFSSVPTGSLSSSVTSSLMISKLPTVPSSTPNRENVASSETMQEES